MEQPETLEAGRYEIPLDREDHPLMAQLTVPQGWLAGGRGPNLVDTREAFAGVSVHVVTQVAVRPCAPGTSGMEEVTWPDEVVAALTRVPRSRVVVAPRPDDRFGSPGTHLRVQMTGPRCPARFGVPQPLSGVFNTPSGVAVLAPGDTADMWVVDVHGTPVAVVAVWSAGTDESTVDRLDAVLDSVVLDPRS